MSKVSTADDFLDNYQEEYCEGAVYGFSGFSRSEVIKALISFAKLHVELALQAASEKAKIIDDPNSYTGNTGSEYPADQIVDRKSILTAYPLKNIS